MTFDYNQKCGYCAQPINTHKVSALRRHLLRSASLLKKQRHEITGHRINKRHARVSNKSESDFVKNYKPRSLWSILTVPRCGAVAVDWDSSYGAVFP